MSTLMAMAMMMTTMMMLWSTEMKAVLLSLQGAFITGKDQTSPREEKKDQGKKEEKEEEKEEINKIKLE